MEASRFATGESTLVVTQELFSVPLNLWADIIDSTKGKLSLITEKAHHPNQPVKTDRSDYVESHIRPQEPQIFSSHPVADSNLSNSSSVVDAVSHSSNRARKNHAIMISRIRGFDMNFFQPQVYTRTCVSSTMYSNGLGQFVSLISAPSHLCVSLTLV